MKCRVIPTRRSELFVCSIGPPIPRRENGLVRPVWMKGRILVLGRIRRLHAAFSAGHGIGPGMGAAGRRSPAAKLFGGAVDQVREGQNRISYFRRGRRGTFEAPRTPPRGFYQRDRGIAARSRRRRGGLLHREAYRKRRIRPNHRSPKWQQRDDFFERVARRFHATVQREGESTSPIGSADCGMSA